MRVVLLLLCLAPLTALADDPVGQFQEALYQEVVEGRPELAVKVYRELVRTSTQPELTARARLGIGRCLQKLNQHGQSLEALHQVLRLHSAQVPIVRQALALIRAYQREAEQAVRTARDLQRLRGEKQLLEQRLEQARAKGQSELRTLRSQLTDLKRRLSKLEAEGASRPRGAGQLLKALSARKPELRKTAIHLADHFLRTAQQERRQGRYRQALRALLLARQYAPEDERIAGRIAAMRALLGEGATPQLDQLRIEADQLRSQLERQMTLYDQRLRQIRRTQASPLARLAALRALLAELPDNLLSSPPANQARSRVIALMTTLAADRSLPAGGAPLPDSSGDRLAWYTLPQWVQTRNPPGGGIRTIRLDRQLRPIGTQPTEPPGPEEWRRALHSALARLVSLDDPRAEAFALPTRGRLAVIAQPVVHNALEKVLNRIRRGQGRLYEVKLHLVQFAAGAAVPWARWSANPAAAGDGSYLILDSPARATLLEQLAEGGAWQQNTIGPLRLWGRQQGLLEVSGKSVFLVGYRQRLVGGRLRSEPLVRTLSEGLSLNLRTLLAETGIRLELGLSAARLARPVHSISTPSGRIQVPSRASQTMSLDVELPRDGALLLFGLTNPIELTRAQPGRLAVIVEARTLAQPPLPRSHIVRRFPLGSVAALSDDRLPDLGARRLPPDLTRTVVTWLRGDNDKLALSLTGSGLTASGTPQALTSLKQRLSRLRRMADQPMSLTIRGWRTSEKALQGLGKLAGGALIAPGGRLISGTLSADKGQKLAAALARSGATALPLPPGPYPTRGVARLVASRVSLTRFVRDPGGPGRAPRYATVGEGIALALRVMPDDRLDFHFMISRLKELVPIKRPGGTGFEPRRTILSGSLTPTLPAGGWAVVSGLIDPAHPKQRLLILVRRGR